MLEGSGVQTKIMYCEVYHLCLGQGTLGCCSLSSLLFGCFSSPQTLKLTPASYSHSTSTSLYIQYAIWTLGFFFFFFFSTIFL